MLGTKNLGDILSERESIAHELHELLFEATEPWGVQVERVEVRIVLDHILPYLDLLHRKVCHDKQRHTIHMLMH